MSSPSSPLASTVVSPSAGGVTTLTVGEIDRSCRWPVLLLFAAGACWLAWSGLFGLLTAIKNHASGFIAGASWLTYGRVRPFSSNAFIYGFVIQTGLGLALWISSRLGRNRLQGGWIIGAGTVLWNLGLAIGLISILAGDSTGYEWMEIPRTASPVMFLAYLLVAAWALINLHGRNNRDLFVSQWFLLAALLWFPWIYATAQILLVMAPVRGVMQAVVNGWYAHNLFEVAASSFGLASIFYFLPKLTGRPLYSRGLILFGFWFFVLLGGWGGVRVGEPVPNWMGSVGVVARVILLLPIFAFGLSWFQTAQAGSLQKADPTLRFTLMAAVVYVAVALLAAAASHPAVSQLTSFTIYNEGVTQLRLHGFLAMALAGAVYYVAPKVAGCPELPRPTATRLHFWMATLGTAASGIALLVGGLLQGTGINDPGIDFVQVVRRTVPFLGINSLGVLLLLVAYVIFFVQLLRILMACCPVCALWSNAGSRATPVRAGRRSA